MEHGFKENKSLILDILSLKPLLDFTFLQSIRGKWLTDNVKEKMEFREAIAIEYKSEMPQHMRVFKIFRL